MSLAERINEAMGAMSPADLARATKKTPGAVTQWLDGTTKSLKAETAAMIEAATGYRAIWIATGRGPKQTSNVAASVSGSDVPMISWVQAGEWCGVIDNFQPGDADEWLPCPVRHGPQTYALIVRGISMFNPGGPVSFKEGDTIFVDPGREAGHGSLVVARLDDEHAATFKQLIIEGEQRMLQALNPSWPNRIILIDRNMTLCGVVIGKLESYI